MLSAFNRRYELMPEGNRIIYDNFYSAAVGIAFILGPLLGGGIKHLLESIMPFAGIRMLYILSTGGILLLQIIYSLTQRKGTRPRCIPCEGETCCAGR